VDKPPQRLGKPPILQAPQTTSVVRMVNATRRFYLAEWYRAEVTERLVDDVAAHLQAGVAAVDTEDTSVQLLMTMIVPADEVLYCLFSADTPELVIEACQQAGMPADRMSTGIDALMSSQPAARSAVKHKSSHTGGGEVIFAHFGTGS
jgi:Protein of unknown function (DUF4242)